MKALTTTLCVFQLSTQEVVYQSFKHVSLLKEISTRWKIVEVVRNSLYLLCEA